MKRRDGLSVYDEVVPVDYNLPTAPIGLNNKLT
jgi:hypothetical protein